MTLGTTNSFVSHEGNGTNKTFNVTFEFHAASDLEVILVNAATGAERVQTQGFHYHVMGGDGELGQIRFVDSTLPPTSGERVLIRRVSSDLQPDDLVDGGALAAEPLERRLDIIAARLQELETDIARSLKVTKGSQATGLDLNLVGGKNQQLTVASDEQGVILTTGTLPDTVQTSQFGEEWVNLNSELEARNRLMLGSAAVQNVGTSGATIPLLNGNNTYSGTASFAGDAAFGSDVLIGAPFVLSSESLGIDGSGTITPTKSHVLVSNFEAAGIDNLEVIAVTNHPFGSILELRAGTAGQVTTLQHDAPGSGNIYLANGRNVALDDRDKTIWLQRRSTGGHGAGWYEIGRSFAFPKGYIHVRHTEPQGTNGGVPILNAWSSRTLNALVANTIVGASHEASAGRVNLPAGEYRVAGHQVMFRTGRTALRLRNISPPVSDVLVSPAVRPNPSQSSVPGFFGDAFPVPIHGCFNLTSDASLQFQYYAENSNGGAAGLGFPVNISGYVEVFADLIVEKN